MVNRNGVVGTIRVAADIGDYGQAAPFPPQRLHRDKWRQCTANEHAVHENIRPIDRLERSATLRLLEVPLDGLEPQRAGHFDGAAAAPSLCTDHHDHRPRRGLRE